MKDFYFKLRTLIARCSLSERKNINNIRLILKIKRLLKKLPYLPLKKAKYTIGVKALTNLRMNVLKMSLSSKLLSVFGTSKKNSTRGLLPASHLTWGVFRNKRHIFWI